jgi:hypothetical protein
MAIETDFAAETTTDRDYANQRNFYTTAIQPGSFLPEQNKELPAGWMTNDSASRYDTQVEVFFNGTANATRAGRPCHEVFAERDRTKGFVKK